MSPLSSYSERAESMRQREKRWRSVLLSRHGIETASASTWQAREGDQGDSPENASGAGGARNQVSQWVALPLSDFVDKGNSRCNGAKLDENIMIYVDISDMIDSRDWYSFSLFLFFIPKNESTGGERTKSYPSLFNVKGI